MRIPVVIALVVLAFSGCASEATTHSQTPRVERPPRTITVEPNQKVTLEPDAVQPGDKIVCVVDGTPFGAVVTKPGTGVAGISDPAYGETNAVTVKVSNQDGTVTAECVVES